MSAWQSIRVLRAHPPGLAEGDKERTAVFVSALEQAEQLMMAAGSVGPAARPLPLFYSLSQAGRAIAACVLPNPWRLAGHGLGRSGPATTTVLDRQFGPPKPKKRKDDNGGDQGARKERKGRPRRRDAFSGVAIAVGSERLSAAVPLAAVWAAIPELSGLIDPIPQPPVDGIWKRPLRAHQPYEPSGMTHPQLAAEMPLQLLIEGLPETSDADVLMAALADYPTAVGAEPYRPQSVPGVVSLSTWDGAVFPAFIWRDAPMIGPLAQLRTEEIAPDYRAFGQRLLIPKVQGTFLSPLILWWVLLFGLSSIARYDPELWVSALNVNRSDEAVPIEAALELAIDAVPELVLLALHGDPVDPVSEEPQDPSSPAISTQDDAPHFDSPAF